MAWEVVKYPEAGAFMEEYGMDFEMMVRSRTPLQHIFLMSSFLLAFFARIIPPFVFFSTRAHL